MATFGWCSTEKPAMFTRPCHVWGIWVLCTHLLQSRPVGYSKLRVPFLFLLSSPLLFSPTTDLHWTSRGAAGSHCNTPCLDWVVWLLCSVINYSFKHQTSVFIHFIGCFDGDQIRCFTMAFPLGKWVLCWWKVIKWVLQNLHPPFEPGGLFTSIIEWL